MKKLLLFTSFLLVSCTYIPEFQESFDAVKNNIEESIDFDGSSKKRKLCEIIKNEFTFEPSAPKAYENVLKLIVDKQSDPEEKEAMMSSVEKFTSYKDGSKIEGELLAFSSEVSKDFSCDEETDELIKASVRRYSDKLDAKWQEEQNKNYEKEIAKLEKKYGYKFCANENIMTYFITGRPLPIGCILAAGEQQFLVFQQVRGGTLLQSRTANYVPGQIVFVTNNKTDSGLPDGVAAPGGYFVRTGSFNYNSVLGAGKTVYKLKRLEAFKE